MSSEKVGYKCPPARTRFRAGISGNPSGRPRRRPSLGAALSAELAAAMPGTNPNRAGSKLQALVRTLVDSAIAGNARAQAIIVGVLTRMGDTDENTAAGLTADDREILDAYVGSELERRGTESAGPETIERPIDRPDDRRHDADDQQNKRGNE